VNITGHDTPVLTGNGNADHRIDLELV